MLQSRDGAGGYINAFQPPFQGLPPLTDKEVYILWACSLLAIPPLAGRAAPQGGFPNDLIQINLSAWASLVQDVAAGPTGTSTRVELLLGPRDTEPASSAGGSHSGKILPPLLLPGDKL